MASSVKAKSERVKKRKHDILSKTPSKSSIKRSLDTGGGTHMQSEPPETTTEDELLFEISENAEIQKVSKKKKNKKSDNKDKQIEEESIKSDNDDKINAMQTKDNSSLFKKIIKQQENMMKIILDQQSQMNKIMEQQQKSNEMIIQLLMQLSNLRINDKNDCSEDKKKGEDKKIFNFEQKQSATRRQPSQRTESQQYYEQVDNANKEAYKRFKSHNKTPVEKEEWQTVKDKTKIDVDELTPEKCLRILKGQHPLERPKTTLLYFTGIRRNKIEFTKAVFNKFGIENKNLLNISFIGKSVIEILTPVTTKRNLIAAVQTMGGIWMENFNPLNNNNYTTEVKNNELDPIETFKKRYEKMLQNANAQGRKAPFGLLKVIKNSTVESIKKFTEVNEDGEELDIMDMDPIHDIKN